MNPFERMESTKLKKKPLIFIIVIMRRFHTKSNMVLDHVENLEGLAQILPSLLVRKCTALPL